MLANAVYPFAPIRSMPVFNCASLGQTLKSRSQFCPWPLGKPFRVPNVSKVISMPDRRGSASGVAGVRDRRYAIRFPFAADVELIDLETGQQVEGVTSDISHGGCFVCTSKPLPVHARARLKLFRKGQTLEALVVVRIVKPRVGMGIEFFDLEPSHNEILTNWIESLRSERR